MDAGDLEAAIRLGESAKRSASRSPSIREFLGLAHYQAGDWKKALSELRTGARLSGSNQQYPVMADCLRASGRPEKALELLSELDESTEKIPEALQIEAQLVRAGIFMDRDDLPSAVGALREVLSEPKNVEIHHLRLWYMLADLFEQAGKNGEARRLFGRIAEHEPDFMDAADRARDGAK